MLVLSRKKNETIVINGDIQIEVLQIKGNQVRLGIVAPKSMKILRSELPIQSKVANEGCTVAGTLTPLNSERGFNSSMDCEFECSMVAAMPT